MRKVFIVVLLFLTQFFSSTLLADEYYNYIQMTCNPTEKKVELENVDQWNDSPSDSDYAFKEKIFQNDDLNLTTLKIYKAGECVFPNGREVRLKISADKAFPYGQCGGSPASWLSLWVDKKKILSQYVYIPTCLAQSSLKSIKIQDDVVEICEYNTTGNFASLEIDTEAFTCKTINVDRDNIEYPVTGKKIPVGSKILEYGFDNPLCQAFINDDWQTKALNPDREFRSCLYDSSLTKSMVDINNDGTLETIYVDSQEEGRSPYTYIYIFNKDINNINTNFENLSILYMSTKELVEHCNSIRAELKKEVNATIPESWAKDSMLQLTTIRKSIRIPHEISPIIYNGRTYLEFYSENIWGLLEYKSNKEFEEKCLYSKVKENY